LRLIPQHPVFGVGPDSVMLYGDQWNIQAYKRLPLRSHFHSTYIQLAVDCGLPCLASFVWLMAAYLIFLGRTWKRALDWEWFPRGALLGIFGGVIGFVLTAFIHYNLGDGEVMILVWLFMGIAMALARMEMPEHRVDAIPGQGSFSPQTSSPNSTR
jgi:O-antigen ligase